MPKLSPSQSAEDYLERIHELIEKKGYARVVDIASSLKVKQASVTSMVQKLAEAGYLEYEKYRTTYELHEPSEALRDYGLLVHVMLDELPYGNFVEIEGGDSKMIRAVSDQLNLNWDAAIGTSYTALFERARKTLRFVFRDLSFENFAGIEVNASHLGVRAADAQ